MRRLKNNKTIEEIAQEGAGNIDDIVKIAQEGVSNINDIVKIANGYQPTNAPEILPAPPKSGSNAVKESIKIEVEMKSKCNCKQYHNEVCEKINCEKDCKFYGRANCYNCIHKDICQLRTNSYCEESVKQDGCEHYISITNVNNNYLVTYRKYRSVFSTDLVISKELVLASNMHEAITKLKELYNNLYDIIAVSILDDSVNFWEDIEL